MTEASAGDLGAEFHSTNSEKIGSQRTFSLMSDDTWYSAHAFNEDRDQGESDEFHDELNVNWCLFGLRFMALFLMACVIASVSLGRIIDQRLFYLAAIIFATSASCLVGSFFDCFKRRFFTTTYATEEIRRPLTNDDSLGGTNRFQGKSLLIKDK
jgi:hypothetical protein